MASTLKLEEIKPFVMLQSLCKSRLFVVCAVFTAGEKLTTAFGGQPHVILKENNKEAQKIELSVFEEQLKTGKLLLA